MNPTESFKPSTMYLINIGIGIVFGALLMFKAVNGGASNLLRDCALSFTCISAAQCWGMLHEILHYVKKTESDT